MDDTRCGSSSWVQGGAGAGVLVHAGAVAELAGNRVHGFSRSGVEAVGWHSHVTLEGNEVAQGGGVGVWVREAAQLEARRNRVLLNDLAGVEVAHAASATLTGNRIAHNAACVYKHSSPGLVLSKENSTSCAFDGCFVCNQAHPRRRGGDA